MNRRIIQAPVVERELIDLAEYIAHNNINAAVRFLDAAEQAFQQLAEMPEMGSIWESENPWVAGLRVWPVKGFENYLIFYRLGEGAVEIVHVVHGSRDFESLFGF